MEDFINEVCYVSCRITRCICTRFSFISSDRKKIKYKPIAIMLIIQLALSYFLLNTQVGYILVKEFQMDLAHFLDMQKLESFSYLVLC